jgi:hypothetical protein
MVVGGKAGHRWLLVAAVSLALLTPAVVAQAAPRQTSDEPIAHLTITSDLVEVQRAEGKRFKPARDGQALREGDTVRTDATGRAEIEYDDQSFTRLDVDTTFTIVTLTDDEGDQTIKGSQETGRTWNRVEALTESESYEVEGAGATAAVGGTAFVVDCTVSPTCEFLAVVDVTKVTGKSTVHSLGPGNVVQALDGNLGELLYRSIVELIGDDWVQVNLTLDWFRGIGPGPFIAGSGPSPAFTLAVEVQGISVTAPGGATPGGSTPGGSTTTTTTTTTTTITTTTTTSPPPPPPPPAKPGCGHGDKNPHTGTPPGCANK